MSEWTWATGPSGLETPLSLWDHFSQLCEQVHAQTFAGLGRHHFPSGSLLPALVSAWTWASRPSLLGNAPKSSGPHLPALQSSAPGAQPSDALQRPPSPQDSFHWPGECVDLSIWTLQFGNSPNSLGPLLRPREQVHLGAQTSARLRRTHSPQDPFCHPQ